MPNPTPIRFTIRQLQFFASVARVGKISDAAVECSVTQSTMTSAIAELERLLGTRLFERSRTGVTLTYEGHLFLQHANSVLDAATEAAKLPFRERSQVEGDLKVVASYTVLGYFLLPHIARFQAMHPASSITPIERHRSEIEAGFEGDDAEVALVLTSNLMDATRFHLRPLASSRRQLWVSPGHALASKDRVTLEDCAAFPYILPLVDDGEQSAMRYWETCPTRPERFLRTSSMEAVREMVALGMGVTILSDMVFRPWSLEGRRIVKVPLENPIPAMEMGLIWTKGRPLSPVAEAFRNYLVDSVGGIPSNDNQV